MKLIVLLMVVVLFHQVHGRNDQRRFRWCHYYFPQCNSSDFNCACDEYNGIGDPSYECIPKSWVCDAYKDCGNGRDELDCVCSPGMFQCHRCNRNESSCIPIYQCIPYNKVCDGTVNCSNNRDEYGGQCQDEGFKCDNGGYVSSIVTRNRYGDCRDGSFQRGCYKYRCNSNKLTNNACVPGECYNEWEKCDGSANCNDHSDEINCSTSCLRFGSIRCACNQVTNYTCSGSGPLYYRKRDKCDGYSRCNDHSNSDEMNCSTCPSDRPIPCACNQVDNYNCTGGRTCYSKEDRCDGLVDCKDHSDEMHCSTCPSDRPIPCACNQVDNYNCTGGRICYSKEGAQL